MTVKRPDVSIYLIARDAAKALDFYVAGLGAVEIARWMDPENGKIGHSEFWIVAQHLFLADEYPSMDALGVKSPGALGGTSRRSMRIPMSRKKFGMSSRANWR